MKDTDKNQQEHQFYVTQDVATYTDKVDHLISDALPHSANYSLGRK